MSVIIEMMIFFNAIDNNITIWLAKLSLWIRVQTTLLALTCQVMVTHWKNHFIWHQYCAKLTNPQWFSMDSVYSYQHQYSSSQWSKCFWLVRHSQVSLQQIIIVEITNKSTNHTKALSICLSLVVKRRKMSIIQQ